MPISEYLYRNFRNIPNSEYLPENSRNIPNSEYLSEKPQKYSYFGIFVKFDYDGIVVKNVIDWMLEQF